MENITIKIAQLRLDAEYPRISTEAGQVNIRQMLLDDQGPKIAEHAADIAKFGLNPADRMMVMRVSPDKAEYIALEGNHRTAALQILANPSLLEDVNIPDSLRRKLTDLADNFDPTNVEPISCVLMPDRESVRQWIELRRTGQSGGRNVVDWNRVQTARFRGDRNLGLIQLVQNEGNLSPDEKALVARNFPITTFARIMSNPVVLQKLGMKIVDEEYHFGHPPDMQINIIKHIVLDLARRSIKLDSIRSDVRQIAYIDSLLKYFVPNGTKSTSALSVTQLIISPSRPAPERAPSPDLLDRKTLVPNSFGLKISNGKAAQIFHELRNLDIDKFPVAGAISLRGFVEAVITIYCDAHAIPLQHSTGRLAGKQLSLSEKVEVVLKHLSINMTKKELSAARASLTSAVSVISVARLNEYVNSPPMFASKSDLIVAWPGIEAFFKAICR